MMMTIHNIYNKIQQIMPYKRVKQIMPYVKKTVLQSYFLLLLVGFYRGVILHHHKNINGEYLFYDDYNDYDFYIHSALVYGIYGSIYYGNPLNFLKIYKFEKKLIYNNNSENGVDYFDFTK